MGNKEWRETTYTYVYKGKTYTEAGATKGLASFDKFQEAKGITGARLLSAITGEEKDSPSAGAIIEEGSEI